MAEAQVSQASDAAPPVPLQDGDVSAMSGAFGPVPGDEITATVTEFNKDGSVTQQDLGEYTKAAEEERAAAAAEQDPNFASEEETEQAAEKIVEQQAKETPGTPPEEGKPDDVKVPTESELALDALRAENAQLRAAAARKQFPIPEVKPDLSDEPDWNDGSLYKDESAAAEARRQWYANKYQEAVNGAIESSRNAEREEQERLQGLATQAEAQRIHEAVRGRLQMDPVAYQQEVNKYASITHPQWNEKFRSRNPVGEVLLNARQQHLRDRASAGVAATGFDTVEDLHEAQLKDHDLAVKIASLPISNETEAVLNAAAAQPNLVGVMRHLTSPDGAADLGRLVRPGTSAWVINGEVARIAAGVGQQATKPAPSEVQVAAKPVAPAAPPKTTVPVTETPGRSQATVTADPGDPDSNEALDARLQREQAELDKTGANGWFNG